VLQQDETMNKLMLIGGACLLALSTVAFRPTPAQGPAIGSAAPNASAANWFNHIGTNIDLKSLAGQAVVIEFWATW
jgi:hypothetical protein